MVQSVLFCDVLRALGDRVAYTSGWIEIPMSQCHFCNMLQTKMMVTLAIEGSFLLRPVQRKQEEDVRAAAKSNSWDSIQCGFPGWSTRTGEVAACYSHPCGNL